MSLKAKSVVLVLALILSACVPDDVASPCKQAAIEYGSGRCSVDKGRQNHAGVWVVKVSCSRETVVCMNNTVDRPHIGLWGDLAESLYNH